MRTLPSVKFGKWWAQRPALTPKAGVESAIMVQIQSIMDWQICLVLSIEARNQEIKHDGENKE